MKYKKQIATGALAISLLIGGSPVFATTPLDLGIKRTQLTYQKPNKASKVKKNPGKSNVVGTIGAISSTGFTVNVKNLKTKITSSIDVVVDASTTYKKDGINASVSDLSVGQKVIIAGALDKTTNILTAKTVKITTVKKNL